MENCKTLIALKEALESPPTDLLRQISIVCRYIPDHDAFVELLKQNMPKDKTLNFDIVVPNTSFVGETVTLEAISWFLKCYLFKWDPSLEKRVMFVNFEVGVQKLRWYRMLVNLEKDFIGFF